MCGGNDDAKLLNGMWGEGFARCCAVWYRGASGLDPDAMPRSCVLEGRTEVKSAIRLLVEAV